jgi:hypothetical protein
MVLAGAAFIAAASPVSRAQQAREPSAAPSVRSGAQGMPPSATGLFAPMERAGLDQQQRNLALIGAASTGFLVYGRAKWWDQGFAGGFKSSGEGWFGRGTENGGTDKLGHMFSNYATTRLMTSAFESAGNGREDSIRLAGWTTLGIFTGIEVIDGYSRNFRFSPEDALMNVAGVGLGVLAETYPALDRRFDFRFSYKKSSGSRFDPFGDYSGQRYLLVAKADGFDALKDKPWLRYLELGVGYQARFTPVGERRRDVYVGISLNLSRLLADGFYAGQGDSTRLQRAADTVFEYLQFPVGGYVRLGLD